MQGLTDFMPLYEFYIDIEIKYIKLWNRRKNIYLRHRECKKFFWFTSLKHFMKSSETAHKWIIFSSSGIWAMLAILGI